MTRIDNLMSADRPYLADGGLETVMIFDEGFDLPQFASFVLLQSAAGQAAMHRYFDGFLQLAEQAGTGFVLDTPTWRAGSQWGGALGLGADAVRAVNVAAVDFARQIRDARETPQMPVIINGVIGPSGDGYTVVNALSPDEAEARHRLQVQTLADAGADLVTVMTMTHSGEAIGAVRAAVAAGVPVVLSFTLETDGRLPSGETLAGAIAATDAATGAAPLFYMINCAHPEHFSNQLSGPVTGRIGGIRANASRMSHAELDMATVLDPGDAEELGHLYRGLQGRLPGLKILGGCCGTGHQHLTAISHHCIVQPGTAKGHQLPPKM